VLVLHLELVNEAAQVFHRPEVFSDESPISTFFARPYRESRWNLVDQHPRKLLDADFGGFLDHDTVLAASIPGCLDTPTLGPRLLYKHPSCQKTNMPH
jgi:hypothetical protein